MMKSIAVVAMAAAATAQSPAADTAFSCNTAFMQAALSPGLSEDDICKAVIQFSRCVSNVLANGGPNADLERQRDNVMFKYQCEASVADKAPAVVTDSNNLEMVVDHGKDVKFYRHRRAETSIFSLKTVVDDLQSQLNVLATVKPESLAAVDAALKKAEADEAAADADAKSASEARAKDVDASVGSLADRLTDAETELAKQCSVDEYLSGGSCKALSACKVPPESGCADDSSWVSTLNVGWDCQRYVDYADTAGACGDANDKNAAGVPVAVGCCASCKEPEFEVKPPTATTDRKCDDIIARCPDKTYQIAAPTRISNRVCAPWATCGTGEFERFPGTAVFNRACQKVRAECPEKTVETAAPSATADRECTPWTECNSDQYETEPGTAKKDRKCRAKSLKGISPRPWFRVTTHYRTWSGKFSGVTMYAVPMDGEKFEDKRYYYPEFQEVCKKYGMQTWRDEDRSSTSNYWGSQDTDTRIYGGSSVRANRCSLGGHDIMTEFYQTFRKSGRCMEARGRECQSNCGGPLLTAQEYAADLKVMGFKDDATYTMVNKKYHSSDYNNEGSWMRFKLTKDYKDVEYQARSNNAVSAHIAICACRECDDNVPCGTWGCCPRETKQCRPVHYKFGYPEFLDSR